MGRYRLQGNFDLYNAFNAEPDSLDDDDTDRVAAADRDSRGTHHEGRRRFQLLTRLRSSRGQVEYPVPRLAATILPA